jgi:hypothetical protein
LLCYTLLLQLAACVHTLLSRPGRYPLLLCVLQRVFSVLSVILTQRLLVGCIQFAAYILGLHAVRVML